MYASAPARRESDAVIGAAIGPGRACLALPPPPPPPHRRAAAAALPRPAPRSRPAWPRTRIHRSEAADEVLGEDECPQNIALKWHAEAASAVYATPLITDLFSDGRKDIVVPAFLHNLEVGCCC